MAWYWMLLIILVAFLFMEFMAWFTHKFVMHGFLWVLHKDHHVPHKNKLEKNDWFAVMFGLPSIILILTGASQHNDLSLSLGIGIALYGFAYFLFHDVYFHQRLRWFKRTDNLYLNAIVNAHADHHKPGENINFGFLVAPVKYYKEAIKQQKS